MADIISLLIESRAKDSSDSTCTSIKLDAHNSVRCICAGLKSVRHLTPRELANLLRLAQGTVTNWRRAGKGPRFVRAESTIRYAMSDVERWLRSENKPQGGQQWTQ